MSVPKDPTDAPFIPSMGGALTPDPGDVDTGMPGTPQAPPERVAEPEDPIALARRLADEAKKKAAAQQAAAAQEAPVKEDPVALAKRLAEEAKQKAAAAKKEDPAALARRLAEEAKKKAAAAKKEDPATLAKRLAEEAKKKAAASQPKPAAKVKAPEPAPKDRFGGLGAPRVKRKSAAEILAEAGYSEAEIEALLASGVVPAAGS